MSDQFIAGQSMTDTAGREQLVSDLWLAVMHLDFARACLADAAKVLQVGLDKEAAATPDMRACVVTGGYGGFG